MAEPTVTVPVSMMQELRDCVGDGSRAVAVQPALRAARAVAALLSQPTPTAETPSVADMVPDQKGIPSTIRDVTPPKEQQ